MGMDQDRRRAPRIPKLMRFVLLWKRVEEGAFSTDASRYGIFLRSAVMPPVGSPITLVVPDGDSTDNCVRMYGTVTRHVRRGDPMNPLGGIGIELERISSPDGVEPVRKLLVSLLSNNAPAEMDSISGPVTVFLPDFRVEGGLGDETSGHAASPTMPEPRAEPVKTSFTVFCKWRNMIIQAELCSLSMEQAILKGLTVRPMVGDPVHIRILSHQLQGFDGTQFAANIDQINYDGLTDQSTVSLALDPGASGIDIRRLMDALRAQIKTDPEVERMDTATHTAAETPPPLPDVARGQNDE
jgi:hypothetical protein